MDPAIQAVFDAMPAPERAGLLALRALILKVAQSLPEVGRIEEALRWGQPSYLTPDTGAGVTIRLGLAKSGGYGLFVTCSSTLIDDFRALAPADMRFDGRRAVLFNAGDPLDEPALSHLIRSALRYHLAKQERNA